MRHSLIVPCFLIAVGSGCSADTTDPNSMFSGGGTVGAAGTAGTAGAATGGGGTGGTAVVGGAGSGGTIAAAGTTGGGGTGGTFVVNIGGAGTGGVAAGGGGAGGGGAGGGGAGGGGAGGVAQGGGGTGGAGGAAATGPCNRTSWTFTPSHICDQSVDCAQIMANAKAPANAIDGQATTRYTSGVPQGSDGMEDFELDFGDSVSITGITITTMGGDGPAMYAADYSTNGTAFMAFAPAVAGTGSDALAITFPATVMQAIRVTQTGMKTPAWWSIHEITVQGCMAQ